jgi:hypothetical protein
MPHHRDSPCRADVWRDIAGDILEPIDEQLVGNRIAFAILAVQ